LRLPQKSSRKFTYIYPKVDNRYRKNIVVLLLTLSSAALYGQYDLSRWKNDRLEMTNAVGAENPIQQAPVRPIQLLNPFFVGHRPGPELTARSGAMVLPFNLKENMSTAASSSIDTDLYVKNFGFFCKKELQLEKMIRLPLRLRLGSLEQCNILEQK
jgi:hypothetical protein